MRTAESGHFHLLHANCGQRIRYAKHRPVHGTLDAGPTTMPASTSVRPVADCNLLFGALACLFAMADDVSESGELSFASVCPLLENHGHVKLAQIAGADPLMRS